MGYICIVMVLICQVVDGECEVEGVWDMMWLECLVGLDLWIFNLEVYEIIGQWFGEFVFVFGYLGYVWVIVGNCYIEIMLMGIRVELSKLVDVVLDIGCSVGCLVYENDFMLLDILMQWCNQLLGWYM